MPGRRERERGEGREGEREREKEKEIEEAVVSLGIRKRAIRRLAFTSSK